MYIPSLASIMSLVAATPLHAWPLIGSAPARRVCQLGAFDCAAARVENMTASLRRVTALERMTTPGMRMFAPAGEYTPACSWPACS